VLLLAAGLVLGLAGCGDDDDYGSSGYTVDFTNHQATASIRVRNNTSERLIAFRGLPSIANLMGGIPANAVNHGLSRDVFTGSADFALTLVTEAEFNRAMAAGGSQALASAAVFNVMYAFYNQTGTNNNVFNINAQSGGAGRLVMENPTAWNVELRQSAFNGQTLGYIGPFTHSQTLHLEPGQYALYPVMRRFNPMLGEIIDVQPVFPDGVIAGAPLFRNVVIQTAAVTWNFLEVSQNASVSMNSGAAFVRVVNNSNDAIEFFSGGVAQTTSMGMTWLAHGQTMTFQVPFPRNPDGSFSFTHTANFGVSVPGVGSPGGIAVAPRTVDIDWLYEIQVTGTTAANIVASALTEIQKLDIEGLFNAN
jgi:hypothetical protein